VEVVLNGRQAIDTQTNRTIRRYDNSHEDTKGHELHVAPDPEPTIIEFPGILELRDRFWRETPKSEFEVDRDNPR